MSPAIGILLLQLILLTDNAASSSEAPMATTTQGIVRGTYLQAADGRQFSAFMSLPYAKPPLGELRFKAPVEAESWDGVRDASQDSPVCIQNNPYVRINDVYGVEDCLFLNVYTAKDLKKSDGNLLPVMIFFHGGGWMTGSGTMKDYGPKRLMQRDIVLVGVNYRIGALGLLSTMDDAAPGNWLFKDQQLAMIWVKNNIKNFGGDPNLVTIFGESAGSASVHYHLMSPKSQGLFHRAIFHSGSALNDWANSSPGHPQKQAKKLGKLMECPTDDSKSMVDCLRSKPAKDLIAADKHFYDWDFDPMIPFRPVVEPENDHSFLSEDPRLILKEGRFAQVPMMWGMNENEGAIRSSAIITIPGLLEEFAENFEELAPITFSYWNSDKPEVINDFIKKTYFSDYSDIKNLNHNAYLNLTDVYSDSYFTAGIDEALQLVIPKASKDTFFYYFTFRGAHSFSEIFGDHTRNYGACHVDELLYLFHIGAFPDLEGKEKDVSDALVTIWTNFAKSGDPKKPISETKIGTIPDWQKMTTAEKWKHLEIGESFKLGNDLFAERKRMWRKQPLWQHDHSVIYKNKVNTEL